MNLNGVTDFAINGVTSRDNGGAGIFLTDAKRGTLADVATSGNEWTGLAFSTAGRFHVIGMKALVITGPLPPAAEQAVQVVVARAVAQVERQDQRIAELTARLESDPSPVVERLVRRAIQAKARIQALTVRRVAAIQRTFSLMGRGRRG